MDIDTIMKEMTNEDSEYNQIIDKLIAPHFHYKNDIIAEVAISYLSNKPKLNKVIKDGYFKYYFIMTVKNQVHSSTSSFHKNIRLTQKIQIDTDVQVTDVIDEWGLEHKLDMEEKYEYLKYLRKNTKMDYFESEMIRLYFDEGMTYRAISREYGVNHTLVYKTVKDVLTRIKKQME